MSENKERILEVKNLRISFRTLNGTVKAVRGINFDLYRGRTLAIVGESGSGKSVTSRAIMGILAPNRIIEEGEILYDGKDLLRLSEEEYVKIRGSRIAMIFQDPMSSLNPIMKVGKQITESMILKQKSDRKEHKKKYKYISSRLISYCEKTKCDADIKNKISTLFNAIKENKDYSTKPLFADADGLLADNNAERKNNSLEAKKLIQKLIDDKLITEDELKTKELRQLLRTIQKKVNICENRLRHTRDEEIATYYVSLKHYITAYKEALVREANDVKKLEKQKKLKEKGKSIEDSAKKRAFSSEIDTSHKAVALKIYEITLKLIEHLDYLSTKEFVEANKRTENLLDYYVECIKGMFVKETKKDFYQRATQLMKEVGIPEPEKRIKQYPFQFSGGMRQRIVIAIALASNPEILICDEPTTALDVTIQAQILELINKLKVTRNLSVIFITHNLGVVANMADDIAVMYAGKIVEMGTVDDIFYNPKHPYTWALLASMPDLETKERLDAIPGTPPNMIIPPKGDAFASRNKYAMKIDFEYEPPFFKVSENHYAATWLLYPGAPKVEPPKIVTDRITRMKKAYTESLKKGAEKDE
ncbi:MAG: oligopeptide/dipeptide ABC transporter ATP-binding protein [Bacilli bacterium]